MLQKRKRRMIAFLMTVILLFGDVVVYGTESETQSMTESESEHMPESETESESEGMPKNETESESEHMPENETESESEGMPESETESESEGMPESETESESEGMPESETESESEHMPKSETEGESEGMQESETESESEHMKESETESESEGMPESESESESEGMPKSETESESEGMPESESETECITENEPESERVTENIGIFEETEGERSVEQILQELLIMMESDPVQTLEASPKDIQKVYENTGQYLADIAEEFIPTVASINGEWQILGLVRSGQPVSDSLYANYIKNVVSTLEKKKGVLHKKKYTEYSRVVLALTALGEDVTNVGGYNLLEPLADFDKTVWQGVNGAIFALLAFDSHAYEIPVTEDGKTQTTRVLLINHILGQEIAGGGFALSGNKADPDMTAMAIQALAPYYEKSAPVKNAVDRAVKKLSEMQMENGGYGSYGVVNVESCAQVVVALTALGIDPKTDERFVKKGRTVLDALLGYAMDDGTFRHVADGGADQMATEQAYYALTAYMRFQEGKTSLYDMSEVALASDYRKAEEINDRIQALPDKITLQDEEKVQNIEEDYQKLTEFQKTLVTKANTKKLQAAMETLAILKAEPETEGTPESETETEPETEGTTETETETEGLTESETETETETETERETEGTPESETEEEIFMIAEGTDETETEEAIGQLFPEESETEEDFQQVTEKNPEAETEEKKEETETPKKPMGTTAKVDLVTSHPVKVVVKVDKKDDKEAETEAETENETETEAETESTTEAETEIGTEAGTEVPTEAEAEPSYDKKHYDEATGIDLRDNEEEILPWYVTLKASRELLSEEQAETVKKILKRKGEIFQVYRTQLSDRRDDSQWQSEDLLRVSVPLGDIGEYENAAILLIREDGTLEFLEGHISASNLEFDAEEFSLFGVVGFHGTLEELMEEDNDTLWFYAVMPGAAALGILLFMMWSRRKRLKVK